MGSSSFFRVSLAFTLCLTTSALYIQCDVSSNHQEEETVLVMDDAILGKQYTYQFIIEELDSNCMLINSGESLPTGLFLDPFQGLINGIPEENGTFYFQLTVLDTVLNMESNPSTVKLKVNLPEGITSPHQFYISTNSLLPAAYSGESYHVRFEAKNNIGNIRWKCSPLPSGLVFDDDSAIIIGTPIQEGLFCIDVSAQDIEKSGSRDFKTYALQVMNPKSRGSPTEPNSPRRIDNILARLECGHILFTAPKIMKQFEEREVTLLITLDKLKSDLKSWIIDDTDIGNAISRLDDQNYDIAEIDKSVENIENEITSSEVIDQEYVDEQLSDIKDEVKGLKDKNADIEQLESAIDELTKLTITGSLISEKIRLSNSMSAKLEGRGFEIDGSNGEVKAVGARSITEWKWIIKAIKSKKQEITLTVYAHVQSDNIKGPYEYKVFEENIEVKVSILGSVLNFHKNHWEFIWSVVLIPFVIYLINKIRGRKNQ